MLFTVTATGRLLLCL